MINLHINTATYTFRQDLEALKFLMICIDTRMRVKVIDKVMHNTQYFLCKNIDDNFVRQNSFMHVFPLANKPQNVNFIYSSGN